MQDVSQDGRFLAVAGFSTLDNPTNSGIGQVVVWELTQNREVLRFTAADGYPTTVCFSSDSRFIATAGTGSFTTIRVWRTEDWTLFSQFHHPVNVNVAEFTPDSKSLFANGEQDEDRYPLVRWEFTKSPPTRTVSWHSASPQDIAFAPDGKSVAIADERGAITSRNLSLDKILSVILVPDVEVIAFSPNGKQMSCVSLKAAVDLIDIGEKKVVRQLDVSDEVFSAIWVSNTELLLGTRTGRLELWDTQEKRRLAKRQVHTAPVLNIKRIPGDASNVLSVSISGVRKSSFRDPPRKNKAIER